jgi:hypothetical protein
VLDCEPVELHHRLEELESELRAFSCRPRTLAGDLVLFGLGTDVMETAASVLHTAASALPHKAYSNARLAFEGAQILAALATHEKYEIVGSHAWVYFEMKSAAWRASAQHQRDAQSATDDHRILQSRVEQMAKVWDSVCLGRGKLLRDAFELVWQERKKRPDNCLHENMASALARNYHTLLGKGDPATRQGGCALAAVQGRLTPGQITGNASRQALQLADRLNQLMPRAEQVTRLRRG